MLQKVRTLGLLNQIQYDYGQKPLAPRPKTGLPPSQAVQMQAMVVIPEWVARN